MEIGEGLAIVSFCSSILIVIGFAFARDAVEAPGRIIGFEERVVAQRAIEEVFWRHRIWPKENPAPKPSLSEVMSASAIRTKVEEALLESTALEAQWQQPTTTAELQAEMERMAKQTRDPAMLRELFDALNNDPALIAETLVRSSLADRRIRALHSRDERIQGAIRRQAERTLAQGTLDPLELEAQGGVYNERTARDEEKDELLARVAARFATSKEHSPLQRWSALEEDEESFFAIAVLEITKERVTTATARWRKEPFESWWAQKRGAMAQAPLPRSGPFNAVSVSTQVPCEPGTWSSLPGGLAQFAPALRTSHSAVWTGAEMIIWGGSNGQGASFNSGGRYNPVTDSWTPTSVGANVPAPRSSARVVWTGTQMIVFGGTSATAGGRYDPAADIWAPMATAGAPAEVFHQTVIWVGTRMIVWGGQGETSALDSGGRYRPATDDWLATSLGPGSHAGHAAVWSGTEMLAVWGGGGLDPPIEDGSRYDPATNTWNAFGFQALVNRQDASAVWTGSEVLLWGGVDNDFCARRDGRRYHAANGTWTTVTLSGAPLPRSRHAGVWTGSKFLAWGGIVRPEGCAGTVTATSDGGRYAPATSSWSATAPRQAGTTSTLGVWTGEEMIVWIPRIRTCERYDPASDTWAGSCTSPSTPSSRDGASLVWTGGRAIAWGGADAASSQIKNDGGIFDPASGAWLSLAAGIPAGRSQHSAVWTGLQMFVWGGFESPTTLSNSGAAFCDCPNESSPYIDADQDGWGGALRAAFCDGSTPPGTSALSGDCNDSDPAVYPDGVETCNGIDDDCDGAMDDVAPSECADGVDCTNDLCQFGACVHEALDSRCQDAVACTVDQCSRGTGCAHTPVAGACDDGLVCTPDTCDPTNGCGHAPNDGLCDDGIACTANTCNPTDGCVYPPNDSDCEDGNPCSRDRCEPTYGCVYEPSGACDHDPRDLGYWRAVCASQVPGVALRPADVACVSATCVFDEVGSVEQACARLRPASVSDGCQQADAQLMAALLNRCVGRVGGTFPIESTCDGSETSTIQQSIQDADAILCQFRQPDYCAHARCATAEIADGGALHTSSLRLSRDPGGTRLNWSPPFAPDLGPPTSYKVWRRVGAAGAFELAHTTSDAFWVDAGDEPRVDYEVRYSWSAEMFAIFDLSSWIEP